MLKRGPISILMFSFIFFAFCFAFSVQAQVQNGDINLNLTPRFPAPNEEVTATLTTYSTDLNRARISWYLNGQLSSGGVGNKNFSFRTGNAGTSVNVNATIEASDGSIVEQSISITPESADMLWQAEDSYVPPFYRGKALVPTEGIIKVVAMTPGRGGLAFNWKQDGTPKPSFSGYGKNYYIFKNSYLETSNEVSAEISDMAGNPAGTGRVTLRTTNPKILFYENDPILGVKHTQALANGFFVSKEGKIIVAEPYFFSPKDIRSANLEMKWTLGGNSINNSEIKNQIGIKPANSGGTDKIKVSVNTLKRLFLSMEKEINVNF